jgi:glycosyltransferase involved in cell wall biosynthesis
LNTPKHIAILCSRLDLPGGIERTIANTSNLFTENGHKVSLVILDDVANSFYPIDGKVQITQQKLSFGITKEGNVVSRKIKLLTDVLKLSKILKQLKADIVIATEYPFAIAAVLTGAKKHSKILSWEHHHYYELEKNNFWERSFKLSYPKLDEVVCLNEDEKKIFAQLNPNTAVIPNFIKTISKLLPIAIGSKSQPLLLTIARLTPVKGISLLLETAEIVLKQNPHWKWKIIGDGEMKNEVLAFIKKENLRDRLILQPPVDHKIENEYHQAAIYVMTSENECFPMTLLEAMSAGTPCVAVDCETGPRHIIRNNEDGLLVKERDPQKLAAAISSLIIDEQKRKKMGEKAFENIQRFSAEKIFELWENIFS